MRVLLGSQRRPRCRYRVLWQRGQSGLQDITPGRDTNPFQFLEFGLSRGVLIKQCFQSAPKTKPLPCVRAEARCGSAAAWQRGLQRVCSPWAPGNKNSEEILKCKALHFMVLDEHWLLTALSFVK